MRFLLIGALRGGKKLVNSDQEAVIKTQYMMLKFEDKISKYTAADIN
jgi:hypothetical protein